MVGNQTPDHSNPLFSGGEISKLKEKIKRYRKAVPVSFILVIIFFFFSFCNFKCNGSKVATLSGINLVTGTQLKAKMDNAFNSFHSLDTRSSQAEGKKVYPNFWAISAFLAAIAGIVVFFKIREKENLWGTLLGVAGMVSLIILRFVIRSEVDGQGQGMVDIETTFLFGYWASLLAFIVAGSISYLRWQDTHTPEQPKKNHHPIHINVITTSGDSIDSV